MAAGLVCPEDGTQLVALERSGVTIDACPQCRGVWLERGELDKILERERREAGEVDDDFVAEMTGGKRGRADERSSRPSAPAPHKKKKRRSLLEEFLDFE